MNPLKKTPSIDTIISNPIMILFSTLVFILFFLSMNTIETVVDIVSINYEYNIAMLINILIYVSWVLAGAFIIKFFFDFSKIDDVLKDVSTPRITQINDLAPGVYELWGIQEYMFRGGKRRVAIVKHGHNFFALDLGDDMSHSLPETYRDMEFPVTMILEGRKRFLPGGKEIEYSVLLPQKENS